ncbi:hepatoma-derived growth factor- protein [Homalodisca vitripennis]|nr:hepatoma-derived growth factor- protein [Homalodisca vitripennis]
MYIIGELVFARLRGHPYWPAQIKECVTNESGKPPKYNVEFFGDHDTAMMKEGDICLYSDYKHIHGKPKTDNFKNKNFNKALTEAQMFYLNSLGNDTLNKNDSFSENTNGRNEPQNISIKVLESSLIENNFLETSGTQEDKLEMAAKIGSALVEENEYLKKEITNLHIKLTITEGKLEELENEERNHINKIETLLELNANTQAQLTKEKQSHSEAQRTYEDHDLELNQLIENDARRIKELEKTISTLNKKIQTQEIKPTTLKDSTTQTLPPSKYTQMNKDSNTSLLHEMSHIKTKLDQLILNVSPLTTELNQAYQEKLENILMGPKPSKPLETTPHYRENLTIPKVTQSVKSVTRLAGPPTKTNKHLFQAAGNKQINKFSVSLQVKKSTEKPKVSAIKLSTHSTEKESTKWLSLHKNTKITRNQQMKISDGPPLNARRRSKDESYNDFFVKNIDFYITLKKKEMDSENHVEKTGSSEDPDPTPHLESNLTASSSKEDHRQQQIILTQDETYQQHFF